MDDFKKAELEAFAAANEVEVAGTKAEIAATLEELGFTSDDVADFVGDATGEHQAGDEGDAVNPPLPENAPQTYAGKNAQRSPLPVPTEPDRGGLTNLEKAAAGLEVDEDE